MMFKKKLHYTKIIIIYLNIVLMLSRTHLRWRLLNYKYFRYNYVIQPISLIID